jgi:hypothetical protein
MFNHALDGGVVYLLQSSTYWNRLRLPPRRLELRVVWSNPARVLGGSFYIFENDGQQGRQMVYLYTKNANFIAYLPRGLGM